MEDGKQQKPSESDEKKFGKDDKNKVADTRDIEPEFEDEVYAGNRRISRSINLAAQYSMKDERKNSKRHSDYGIFNANRCKERTAERKHEEIGYSWRPPENADVPTPYGIMLTNLGEKLRKVVSVNHSSSREELSASTALLRNCKSHTEMSEEKEALNKALKRTGSCNVWQEGDQNANAGGECSPTKEKNLKAESSSKSAVVILNKPNDVEFHEIPKVQPSEKQQTGNSLTVGKLFRTRAKSDTSNKKEMIYKDKRGTAK